MTPTSDRFTEANSGESTRPMRRPFALARTYDARIQLRQKAQVHQLLRGESFRLGIFERCGIDDQLHALDAHPGVVGQAFLD